MAPFNPRTFLKNAWPMGLFGLSYLLLEWLHSAADRQDTQQSLRYIFLHLPIVLLACWWHRQVTLRFFRLPGRRVGAGLSLLGGILFFSLVRREVNYYFYDPAYFPEKLLTPFWDWPQILIDALHLHVVVALFLAIFYVRTPSYPDRSTKRHNRLTRSVS